MDTTWWNAHEDAIKARRETDRRIAEKEGWKIRNSGLWSVLVAWMRFDDFSTVSILAGLCHAAAPNPGRGVARSDLTRVIAPHEAILYGENGQVEIWNKTDILAMDFFIPLTKTATTTIMDSQLRKRGEDVIVVENSDSNFLGWDIPKSQTVHSPAGSKATIAVLAGYSISNFISVSEAVELSLIKDVLESTSTVTYDHTWTSTESTTNSFQINEGKTGVIVSNPLTFRKSGTIFTGRIGSEGTTSTYMADSFTSKSYSNLE